MEEIYDTTQIYNLEEIYRQEPQIYKWIKDTIMNAMLDNDKSVRREATSLLSRVLSGIGCELINGYSGDQQLFIKVRISNRNIETWYVCDMPKTDSSKTRIYNIERKF